MVVTADDCTAKCDQGFGMLQSIDELCLTTQQGQQLQESVLERRSTSSSDAND